jgi:two-component system cell cycle response regulator
MKIKILLVNSFKENINLFQSYFSKELYEVKSIEYDSKTFLQNYEVDLIIIDNSMNNMDFQSLFNNHDDFFFVNIALFLYGDYKFIEEKYFKYFDDILLTHHDEHLIRSKIFSILKYYFKLDEAKKQNRFSKIDFNNIYKIEDCRIAFIDRDEKIFNQVHELLGKKVLSIVFIQYNDYYDDFLKFFEDDFDLVFLSGIDSIHHLVYFYSKIQANKNFKDAHILSIKKNTDLIFPADIINVGINNYIDYPIESKELVGQTIVQLKNKKHFDDFDKVVQDEINSSWKDELTDLFNKRYLNRFLENLDKTHSFARRIGFIMIDFDNLKEINDEYGHFIGDQILKEFSYILKQSIDELSIAARFGGDEFCIIIMNNKDIVEDEILKTQNIIKKIEKLTEENFFTTKRIKLSISCGFTITQENDSIIDLISRADKEMYKNKFGKKNKFYLRNGN